MSMMNKLALAKEMLDNAESSVRSAKRILAEISGQKIGDTYSQAAQGLSSSHTSDEGKVIEGIFSGERMKAQDGEEYPVPANYASKSKLIPGDVLKLTIADDGRFLYKQIGPVARRTVIGTLVNENGQFRVLAEGHAYRVLLASVTYFKAEVGDRVTLIIPEAGESDWGAIEAVLPHDVMDHDAQLAELMKEVPEE